MVAGETEAILEEQAEIDNYDNFLFGKRNENRVKRRNKPSVIKRRTARKQRRSARKTNRIQRRDARRNSPIRAMRRQRRSTLIRKIGNAYRDAGRASGIGASIDSLTPSLDPNYPVTSKDTDYKVSIGETKTPEEKSGIPKVALVIGGVAVVGLIGAVAMSRRNS